MPDPADELLAAAREQAAELELAADQLASLLRSMTDVRVGVLIRAVGMGELSAYELAKAEAARLLSWSGLAELIFDANEPETSGGAVEVGVLVGVTTLDPAEAVRSACAELTGRRWSPPQQRTVPAHQFAFWCAEPVPAQGLARVEVHAAPGLATVTDRQRREMLDDPDYSHLHDLLRLDQEPS